MDKFCKKRIIKRFPKNLATFQNKILTQNKILNVH